MGKNASVSKIAKWDQHCEHLGRARSIHIKRCHFCFVVVIIDDMNSSINDDDNGDNIHSTEACEVGTLFSKIGSFINSFV